MNPALNSITKNVAGFWGAHVLISPGHAAAQASAGVWDRTIVRHDELEAGQLESTEAQNPLDLKGGDKPREFSISVQVNAIANKQNPLAVYKAWQRDLGKSNLFFIGDIPYHTSRYILQRVEFAFANRDIHAMGTPFRGDINLTFTEDTMLEVPSKGVETPQDPNGTKSASKVGPTKAEKVRVWKTENDMITDADIDRARKNFTS